MDKEVHNHNLKRVQINKSRHFFFDIYPYKYSDKLKRYKIICHSYYVDRFKIYDFESLLNETQPAAIKEFLSANPQYTKENSVFYTLIELSKGISFSPDLRVNVMFYKAQFAAKADGIVMGQILGLVPKLYNKLLKIISKERFGMAKGVAYDFADNYEEILEAIDRFDNIVSEEDLPDYVRNQVL